MKQENAENLSTGADPGNGSKPESSEAIKEISCAVLFFGAVFIVSAMETGSYRTSWPVAILTTLAGIGLYAYARRVRKKQP